MSEADLAHARSVIGLLVRDTDGRLAIPPHALPQVEQRFRAMLDDPEQQEAFLDQVLRLAHAVFVESHDVELARTLVRLAIQHPFGRARVEATQEGQSWSRFAENTPPTAPPPHAPPPEGTLPASRFVERKFRR